MEVEEEFSDICDACVEANKVGTSLTLSLQLLPVCHAFVFHLVCLQFMGHGLLRAGCLLVKDKPNYQSYAEIIFS